MNSVFDILNHDNTMSLNRPLAHALGVNEALAYIALVSKFRYYSEHNMLSGGWFYSTISDLDESTALSESKQKTAIKNLVKAGLIKCERKGLPGKRCFYIEDNYALLQEIINKCKEIILTKKPNAYLSPATENYVVHSADVSVEEYRQYEEDTSALIPKQFDKSNEQLGDFLDSTSAKISEHTYNNLKGNKPKGSQSINPRKAHDTIDMIDQSEREKYRSYLKDTLEYDTFTSNSPQNKQYYDEMLSVVTDVLCSKKPYIRVNGDNMPHEVVKSVFLKLDESHFEYVLDSLQRCTTKVRNIRSYLITALYNAPQTINSYYQSLVNHDMYGTAAGMG